MSFCELNGHPVSAGRFHWPLNGVPTADLDTEMTEAPTGQVELVVGSQTIVAHVARAGLHAAQVKAFLAWGKATLGDAVKSKSFTSVTVQSLLTGIAGDASTGLVPGSLLSQRFDKYVRKAGTKQAGVQSVADTLGAVWRVLDDGRLLVALPAWEAFTEPVDVVGDDQLRGCLRFGDDGVNIRPGHIVAGKNINSVELEFSPGKTDVYAYYGAGMAGSFAGAVKSLLPDLDPYGFYPCTVVAQSNNLKTVDVSTSHPKISSMSGVKLRFGLPGITAQISRGAKVMVGFEGGDRRKPYVDSFEDDSIAELTIKTSAKVVVKAPKVDLAGGAGARLARVGSVVQGTATVMVSGVPVPCPFQAIIANGSEVVSG